MAQATPYSFTERKRIRKSFGKRESVLNVPYLLTMQRESYVAFLQKDVPPAKRKPEGLQAAFLSAFPITSHNSMVEMKFIEYNMAKPAFDVRECQQRGLTFAAAVRAKLQMIIYDRESHPQKVVKEIKEQEVYMGEVPLMTDYGSFIVNGTERVIVSQLHRSPGVFFEHDKGKTHSSGKLLFSARIIPYRGSWLDFEFDPKDILYFRVDRRRKMPVTILLKAIGLNPEQILAHFFVFDNFRLMDSGAQMEFVADRIRGEVARFDITDKNGNVVVEKDKRITARHVRTLEQTETQFISVPEDFLVGRVVARNVVDADTGEIAASLVVEADLRAVAVAGALVAVAVGVVVARSAQDQVIARAAEGEVVARAAVVDGRGLYGVARRQRRDPPGGSLPAARPDRRAPRDRGLQARARRLGHLVEPQPCRSGSPHAGPGHRRRQHDARPGLRTVGLAPRARARTERRWPHRGPVGHRAAAERHRRRSRRQGHVDQPAGARRERLLHLQRSARPDAGLARDARGPDPGAPRRAQRRHNGAGDCGVCERQARHRLSAADRRIQREHVRGRPNPRRVLSPRGQAV